MSGVKDFVDLKFWQRSRQWSKLIYRLTRNEPFRKDRRLVTQINDSSESVYANIAEGFGRGTQGEFVTFLGYSIGSLNETQAHLCAAFDRDYVNREDFASLFSEGTAIRKMTIAFIQSMIKPGSGVKHIRPLRNWTEEGWERYERITGKPRPDWVTKGEYPTFDKNQSK